MSRLLAMKAARDERGTVAIIFALSCVVLLIVIGIAVDGARYYNVSTRMQAALDGASLAAAKLLPDQDMSDADVKARALSYFSAASETFGVKPASITPLTVIIDRATPSVVVQGGLEIPTLFGRFAGLASLTAINQKAKVVYDLTTVELAMVLDITGSMGTNGKLSDLKFAASDVIDILFDGALTDTSVKIALAPYSASVNAGEFANDVTTLPRATSCYKPCWSCRRVCTDTTGSLTDTCVLERQGGEAFTDAAPSGSARLPNVTGLPFVPASYTCPGSSVIPLSDRTHRDDLKAAIRDYSAAGATAGQIGTAWGWYLLSPNWTSVFPAESAPQPYGKRNVQKAMIVMTDGEFNASYTGGADQTAQAYSYFDSLCAAAKADGIMIYTVGFDLNAPDALAHLESCASSPVHFYDAKTGAQLKSAFKDIANKLANLRVAS